jgi:hypothetical protein
MKISKRQLRQIVERIGGGGRYSENPASSQSISENTNPAAREIAVEVMEDTLNNLWQEGFDNADLIAILEQLKLDVERGFIGEPS